jgi:hypothetical protein
LLEKNILWCVDHWFERISAVTNKTLANSTRAKIEPACQAVVNALGTKSRNAIGSAMAGNSSPTTCFHDRDITGAEAADALGTFLVRRCFPAAYLDREFFGLPRGGCAGPSVYSVRDHLFRNALVLGAG